MQLFVLMFGKSKKKMKPIMVDSRDKCENYKKARNNVQGWHEIIPADKNAEVWRQKSSTIGGNKCVITKTTGKNRGPHGYISKHGFNPHT